VSTHARIWAAQILLCR